MLFLQENQLFGALPDLSNFPVIKHIDFNFNRLEGTLHDYNLHFLKQLSISGNNISGTLPTFENCPKLLMVDLFNNYITGTIPRIDKLVELEEFTVFNNRLKGTIHGFEENVNLKTLYLMMNDFTGTLPSFSELSRLEILFISNTLIGGTIPNFQNLPKLKQLALSDNKLFGTIPPFDALKSIEKIYLYNNNLIGTIPNLNHLSSLKEFTVQSNRITGTIPANIFSQSVELIDISNNLISGTIPEFSTGLSVKSIDFSGNNIQGSLPDFRTLNTIEEIRLSRNNITGSIPDITTLSQLKVFSLTNNHMSGSVPNMQSLTNLRTLQLSSNQLSGTLPGFSNPLLEFIDISYNRIEGEFPAFMDVPELAKLDLSHNILSGLIPRYVDQFHNLTYLNLAHNYFSGQMPQAFWNLKKLIAVDLRNNSFTGDVAWFISPKYGPERQNYSYEYLYLDNNNLHGALTWWIYSFVPQIQVLSLRNNNITRLDDVPNLIYWKYLDVSGNPIQGELPESFHQFISMEMLDVSSTRLKHKDNAYIPSFLTYGDPYELKERDRLYLCPSVGSRLQQSRLVVNLNPSYYDHIFCECLPNYFGFADFCLECPRECDCTTGGSLKACFASPSTEAIQVLVPCPVKDACQQEVIQMNYQTNSGKAYIQNQCSRGYRNRVCSQCETDYGLRGRTCVDCGGYKTLVTIILAPFALLAIIAFLIHFSTPESGKLNIIVFHMQTLSILYSIFTNSKELSEMVDISFSIFSITIPSTSCILGTTNAMSPMLFSYARVVILLISGIYIYKFVGSHAKNKVIYVSVTILHIMYYQVTREVFSVFGCTLYDEGTDSWYLNMSPWIACSPASDEYRVMIGVTVPVFVLFVAAFPYFVWKIMRDIRISNYSPLHDFRYGFLYLPFKTETQYWELVILARRIAFSFVVTVIPYTSHETLFLMIVIIIQGSIWLQQRFQPYRSKVDNTLEIWSLYIIFVSFFLALLASYQPDRIWLGGFIISINIIAFLIFLLVSLFPSYVKKLTSSRVINVPLQNLSSTPPPTPSETR
eukprot:TRINITY_DN11731_c0_g1_i11.p1 TRINITY_DN11731_c0_g1~~TRINITY_DN11731_c0_g1_i11.p1  ORF type:complete len:1041 (+),score=158.69 TRINITY_DN11731_c0_g1_i11:112-3234(+)